MKLLGIQQLEKKLYSDIELLKEIKDSEQYLEKLMEITSVVTHLYRRIEEEEG